MWALQTLTVLSLILSLALGGHAIVGSVDSQGVQDGPDPLKCLMSTAVQNGSSLNPVENCPDNPFVPQITDDPEPFAP